MATFQSDIPLGVRDGRLADCPDSPNCVVTHATDSVHAISPLEFTDASESAWKRLRQIMEAMPRVTIVKDDGSYLHCECRSRLLRFVDDVEFQLDAENGKIAFRSASRVGYSDLGVNRKRMESIRRCFQHSAASAD